MSHSYYSIQVARLSIAQDVPREETDAISQDSSRHRTAFDGKLLPEQAAAQSLYSLPEGIQTRWASAENPGGEKGKGAQTEGGRKGRPAVPIKAGEQVTLAEIRGSSGTVRRIWVTINDRSPAMLRGLKIEMFWDGAIKPAVSAPLGDFFGLGLGQMVAFQSAFFSSPEGKSSTATFPCPSEQA